MGNGTQSLVLNDLIEENILFGTNICARKAKLFVKAEELG